MNILSKNECSRCKVIGKISIVVTEQCNLGCKYCYARLSNRWHKNQTMSIEVADKIINKVISGVDRCEMIQFFGGEPTLNIDVIEYIVCEIGKRHQRKEIESLPRYGIVTNGCFSQRDKTYAVLKKYNIETTISIDGPPSINDQLRMAKNGDPVSEKVCQSIKELQENGVKVAIETVYTAQHIANQYSIVDCIKFVENQGVKQLILQAAYPPASIELNPLSDANIGDYTAYYMQAIDWWFENISKNEEMFSIYFKDILKIMLDDSPPLPSGCPAGVTSYSVGPDGSVYPCQLLYGKTRLYLGNVMDRDFVLSCKQIPDIHAEFEECRSCYARHWCQPCAALNDFFGDMAHPPKSECAIRKAVILRIALWASEKLTLPQNEHAEILLEKLAYYKNWAKMECLMGWDQVN